MYVCARGLAGPSVIAMCNFFCMLILYWLTFHGLHGHTGGFKRIFCIFEFRQDDRY